MTRKWKSYLHRTNFYQRLGRFEMYLRGKLFDIVRGVHTSGRIDLDELNIQGENVMFGLPYGGVDPKLLRVILRNLVLRYEDFVFVDLGSGMGRALLIASEFPFKNVVGVEFSPQLHWIAQLNIARFKRASQKCKNVESVCMDAVDFRLPDSPVVLFFYNPFSETVLAPVLTNIRKSLESHPREMLIVYVYPECAHLLHTNATFTKLVSHDWYNIYASSCSVAKMSRAVERLKRTA